jgi:DNA-binding MarR family transcriptional regulator
MTNEPESPLHPFLSDRTSSQGIGRSLRKANKVYNRLLQDRLAEHDIGLAEFLHLRQLWRDDRIPQAELARRIGIEKASSTKVIAALVAKGYITRQADDTDSRRMLVNLTQKARDEEDVLLSTARGVALKAIHDFTEEEVEAFSGMLDRFVNNLGP